MPCDKVRSLVKRRLERVRARIAELQTMESRMADAVQQWRTIDDPARRDDELCPLIERVEVRDCGGPETGRRETRRNPNPTACHCARPGAASQPAESGQRY